MYKNPYDSIDKIENYLADLRRILDSDSKKQSTIDEKVVEQNRQKLLEKNILEIYSDLSPLGRFINTTTNHQEVIDWKSTLSKGFVYYISNQFDNEENMNNCVKPIQDFTSSLVDLIGGHYDSATEQGMLNKGINLKNQFGYQITLLQDFKRIYEEINELDENNIEDYIENALGQLFRRTSLGIITEIEIKLKNKMKFNTDKFKNLDVEEKKVHAYGIKILNKHFEDLKAMEEQ